uniref:Uncharacterized protein n=1 Tax=Rhizophora mucronata TaxID=61149 RepID=A0A2P2QIG2_RHIMU
MQRTRARKRMKTEWKLLSSVFVSSGKIPIAFKIH